MLWTDTKNETLQPGKYIFLFPPLHLSREYIAEFCKNQFTLSYLQRVVRALKAEAF